MNNGFGIVTVNEVGKTASLDRIEKILGNVPGGMRRATSSIFKRAAQSARTQAGRFASAEYTISTGQFKRHTKETVKMFGTGEGVAGIRISYAGYVLPLMEFQTRVGKHGVVTTVKRGEGSTSLPRAFRANRFGREEIYERLGKERYPLEEKYGPSTAHMMQNEQVIEKMDDTIRETYEKRVEHEIWRILNGYV